MAQQRKKSETLAIGTFDQLMEADDLHSDEIHNEPDWGMALKIRGLTRGESRLLADDNMSAEDREISVITCGVVEPKLTLEQAKELLSRKGTAPTERLIDHILQLSGMTVNVNDAAERVVEAAQANGEGYIVPAVVFRQLETAVEGSFRQR